MSFPAENRDAATLEWINRFAPHGVIVLDPECRVQTWNRWMQVHSGLDEPEAIGHKLDELYPELTGHRCAGQLQRALQGEVSVLSTALHGHFIPMRPVAHGVDFQFMKQTARIAPLILGNVVRGIIIIIEDVTQREWQARLLHQQQLRHELLAWALAHLLNAEAPRETSRELFCKIAGHLDFESYLFYVPGAAPGALSLFAYGGIPPAATEAIKGMSDAPWTRGSTEPRPAVCEDVQASENQLLVPAADFGFTAFVALPMSTKAGLHGVLFFASRSRKTVQPAEVELLGAIAQHLGVALHREATERKLRKAQEQLASHADALEQNVAIRTSALKETIADLQTFSYTVAHDLQAPIRALAGYCDVLLEDYQRELPAHAQEVVGRLKSAAVRMDCLTRDLLAFSAVSRQNLELTPLNLDRIFEEVIASNGALTREAITLATPLGYIVGNKSLVQQCFANLIENAVKFVPAGVSPKVTFSAALLDGETDADLFNRNVFHPARYQALTVEPTLSRATKSRRVRINIDDNGIGVPPEARQKIFGIFDRGAHGPEFAGTGIGLAIVARAMERMNGSCGVEPRQPAGSRFWLEFPVSESQPDPVG